ncbi:MAG: ABC transporter ATP-binding protein [Candidatus Aminicenantes bacterium]|nr:ABC transporter ATP-binding protein [Candidatus Aminicenantes bacterium]
MTRTILSAVNISKSFQQPDKSKLEVLQDLSLDVAEGTVIAVTGASGSGKSTLLHLLGALDAPDRGEILFDGESILGFKGKKRAAYRNRSIGFVFQFHYLMPELTVLENVSFPALIKNFNKEDAYERAGKLLKDVDLGDRKDNMPFHLSGGERQRVAIARSLINSPRLLFADEPTGNLDWKTGQKVFGVFRELIKERNLTAVLVTHNEQLADLVDSKYHLHEGKLS